MLRRTPTFSPAQRELYQAKLGMNLFLAGLVFVFFSGLLVYAVVRMASVGAAEVTLQIPPVLLVSTLALVGVSLGLHRSVQRVSQERISSFLNWLTIAFISGVIFFVCQTVGMLQLLQEHFAQSDGNNRVFGIAFFLAALHAIHVVAGFVIMGWVIFRALRGSYDHERHWPVDICATYWHFLDVVWVVMLVTFLIIR